jgi:hypothetical protein
MRQLVTVCAVTITWCSAASAQMSGDIDFFESKVRPLLIKRCHECHSTQAKKRKGKLSLDSREAILKGGVSGPAVVPGAPDKSLLIQAVRYSKEDLQMPRGGKLPASEIAVLEEWVRRGAVYPGPAAKLVNEDGIDWAKGRVFWSFQTPKVIPLPKVRNEAWPRNRIDTFLLAEMEKRELTPTKIAERRVLIRRASFDLVGLPPTPDEIDAFVNDKNPDAYAKLIDRLLASPHYGERWGRFWLDLARYCDVAEQWAEGKGQAWVYRDWVVQAFNDDMPFDRFAQMQLAADLMPGAQPKDRAALGFLGLSPQYWKELLLDKDVIRGVVAEEWEERIGAVGSTFLGVTVACARCHDHKFDPISTQDYYALAGVFASIQHTDVSLLSDADTKVIAEAQKKIDPLQERLKRIGKSKVEAEIKEVAELKAQIDAIKKATPNFDAPFARGVIESSLHVEADGPHKTKLVYKPNAAQDVAVQKSGVPTRTGAVVPRRFLTVLSPEKSKPFTQGSGRLELARAIVNEGAPLSARVIVNRVWRQHFGAGIVETPSDFGIQGIRPTHPELLDDLTARFIQNGWSLKWLHREIMLSAAYQQASAHDKAKHAVDPDNKWLWRMNRRRLEVEAWRDAMLAVTGTLDLKRGGPPIDLGETKNRRRTLYGTVKRREIHDMLRLFDFPDPVTHSAARLPTTTPLQQLFTLNSPFMQQQSAALVQRLKSEPNDEARIRRAYLLLYGRPATDAQIRLGVEFVGNPSNETAWAQYAQVLLGSNEFLFVD